MPRCASLWFFVLLLAPLSAQDGNPDRTFMTRATPLVEQLRPGDKHIAITINADEPLWIAPPAGVSRERFWADLSDLVIVARVESINGRLVVSTAVDPEAADRNERNAVVPEERANWIVSGVLLRIERVVKGPTDLASGERLLVYDNSGSAIVRGVTIDTVIPWERSLAAGKRYLLFGSILDGNRLSRAAVYEESSPGAKLTSASNNGQHGRLETLTLAEAIDYVERELRR
jgi:hypothetical protein